MLYRQQRFGESSAMLHASQMAVEIAEIPAVVQRLLEREGRLLRHVGQRLAQLSPPVIVTCARGSSDHAAGFAKYLIEIMLGIPVASMGPSVASVYKTRLQLRGAAVLSVSQSGQSPDIVALQAAARSSGALTVAIVNDASSPLANGADEVIALHCGVEKSVAATKTCMASAVASATLIAHWTGDQAFLAAIEHLPDALDAAVQADWSLAAQALANATSCYVIGRGPAFPVAQEAALKLKETAVLHAEAYSSAEVMHGPLQLVAPGFPVVAFHPLDAAHPSVTATLTRISAAGGRVFVADGGTDPSSQINRLGFRPTLHSYLDPLAMLATFYKLAEATARARGHDPDKPSLLRKVTETV